MKKISTIILVAGKSSRFKSKKSKIFHELAGLPIINHIYEKAKKVSKDDIVFVCNKNNIGILKKKFPKCKFALQKKQNGTADAVLAAKKFLKKNSNILILFGDTPLISYLTIKKLINKFFKNNSYGSIMTFLTKDPFGYGRVLTEKKQVKEVVEELNASKDIKKINLCNAGVMLCKYNLLFSFADHIDNKNIKKEKYLPDIFKISFQNGKGFNFLICDENEMLGINTLHDFNKLDKIYQNSLKIKVINSGVKILEPDTVRLSYDTKIGKNCSIEPYVYLKKNVIIKDNVIIKSHTILESTIIGNQTSIGPYARIRPSTTIGNKVNIGNFVEIKNSKIGDNTSISHLSYIGDSYLGKNINIGAGTITCNYDGIKKNKTIIQDNAFIGSNTSLVAPVNIGKNSKTGAGSVITRNIAPNSLVVGLDKLVIAKKTGKK